MLLHPFYHYLLEPRYGSNQSVNDGWMVKEDVIIFIFIYNHTCNGILLSIKIWNTVIYDNMDGSWGFYAQWNQSDRKGQKPCPFLWNMKQKSNKLTKQTHWYRFKVVVTRRRDMGGGLKFIKEANMWQWKELDFWWWAHNIAYRYWITMLYTSNLCNLIALCYLKK